MHAALNRCPLTKSSIRIVAIETSVQRAQKIRIMARLSSRDNL